MENNDQPHRQRGRKPLSIRLRMRKVRHKLTSSFLYDSHSPHLAFLSHHLHKSLPPCKFSFVLNYLDLVLQNDSSLPQHYNESYCFHLFIGSSQVSRLLSGRLRLKDLHSFAYTWKNRQKGRVSEKLILDRNQHFEKGFCLQSRNLPFILAAPDAIVSKINRRGFTVSFD